MKRSLLTIACSLIALSLFAQENIPYAVKAAQLQKEIWGLLRLNLKKQAFCQFK